MSTDYLFKGVVFLLDSGDDVASAYQLVKHYDPTKRAPRISELKTIDVDAADHVVVWSTASGAG